LIVAAGLTPAWQHILLFDGFRAGEVNRAREVHWCASGKVLNVALALRSLGGPSLTVIPAGGPTGESIARELDGLGIRHRLVKTSAPTRVCTTLLEATSSAPTELVENAQALAPREVEEYLRVYGEAAKEARAVVLSGSLPPGTPTRFFLDCLERTRCPAVIDARGPELLETLPLEPLVVKPNREELGRTFGKELRTDEELKAAILEMHRLGARWVVVSQGKAGLWLSGEGTRVCLKPPVVRTVNPIGCGDCMAAGIAWGIAQGMTVPDAVRLGMGAAAQNASVLLPGRLDLPTVQSLAARVEPLG
jgi:1-phosphofructokinase family hexose kinase